MSNNYEKFKKIVKFHGGTIKEMANYLGFNYSSFVRKLHNNNVNKPIMQGIKNYLYKELNCNIDPTSLFFNQKEYSNNETD